MMKITYLIAKPCFNMKEVCVFLTPNAICALKLPFHKIVLLLREKFFTERAKTHLYNMYIKLYSAEQITHVPMQYEEFNQVEIFEQIYT